MGFTGFPDDTFEFFEGLEVDNTKSYWTAHKKDYEAYVHEPLVALFEELEPEFGPAKLFRPYRDVRFAKDKSPYKTHVAASFGWAGDSVERAAGRSHTENVHASGGYFHLQPGEIFVGGGVWHPDPSWLKAFRDRVVADFEGFRDIVEAPEFVETFGAVSDDGESLKRVPPGYPPDHPAADVLRKKNVTFGRRLADGDAVSPRLPSILADAFATGTPLLRYLASI